VEEFKDWCDAVAAEWGYTVQTSTVGRATEIDVWGRDEELGGASQVALFTRLDGANFVNEREEKCKSGAERASCRTPHELLTTHFHAEHPCSRKPGTLQEIGERVKLKMETDREAFMRLEELWFEQEIAILCGGWIELLVKAIEEHDKLKLHRDVEEKRTNWQVELTDGVREQREFWPAKEDENSLDYIPPDYFPEEVHHVSWETESSGVEGDVSAGNSGDEGEDFWGGEEDQKQATDDAGWGIEGGYSHKVEAISEEMSSTEAENDGHWEREARNTQGWTWGGSADEGTSLDEENSAS
jgi:hypothetical protein